MATRTLEEDFVRRLLAERSADWLFDEVVDRVFTDSSPPSPARIVSLVMIDWTELGSGVALDPDQGALWNAAMATIDRAEVRVLFAEAVGKWAPAVRSRLVSEYWEDEE